MNTNPVTWFEVATTDLERAKVFYQAVFPAIEFEFVDMPESPMYTMGLGGDALPGSGGALVQSDMNTPSTDGTTIYFTCDDVAVESARVESAGGQVIVPKMSIGEFGFISLFIDSEGNRIGLHSNQ